jgi:hypothetical protein
MRRAAMEWRRWDGGANGPLCTGKSKSTSTAALVGLVLDQPITAKVHRNDDTGTSLAHPREPLAAKA